MLDVIRHCESLVRENIELTRQNSELKKTPSAQMADKFKKSVELNEEFAEKLEHASKLIFAKIEQLSEVDDRLKDLIGAMGKSKINEGVLKAHLGSIRNYLSECLVITK